MANIININSERIIRKPSTNRIFLYAPNGTEKYISSIVQVFESKEYSVGIMSKEDQSKPLEEDDLIVIKNMSIVLVLVNNSIFDSGSEYVQKLFPIIKEQNLKVLPIVVENISLPQYKALFEDAEYLKVSDPNFSNRVEQYLSLNSDKEKTDHTKVFKKKVFISYRKKDIAAVLKALEAIHQFEEFAFTSFWFDYFLTPGEDFHEEIEKNIDDCDLFLLMVTEHIFETNNYVIRKEYPYALEKNKKVAAIILDDSSSLKTKLTFKSLKNIYDIDKPDKYRKGLNELLELDNEEVEYFYYYDLGLCYLNGLGVEVNRKLGEKCLTIAADNDMFAAMKELAERYYFGRNYEKSIYWYEKCLSYKNVPSWDKMKYLKRLVALYNNTNNNKMAIDASLRLVELQEQPSALHPYSKRNNKRDAYISLGKSYAKIHEYRKAVEAYIKALRTVLDYNLAIIKNNHEDNSPFGETYPIYCELAKLFYYDLNKKKLAAFYMKKSIESLSVNQEYLSPTLLIIYYEEYLKIVGFDQQIADKMIEISKNDTLNQLSVIDHLCAYFAYIEKLIDVDEDYDQAESIIKEQLDYLSNKKDDKDCLFMDAKMNFYLCLIYMNKKDLEKASFVIEKAYRSIKNYLTKETPHIVEATILSYQITIRCASIFERLKQFSVAKEYYDKALAISDIIIEKEYQRRPIALILKADVYKMLSYYYFMVDHSNGRIMKECTIKAKNLVDEALQDIDSLNAQNIYIAASVYYQNSCFKDNETINNISKAIELLKLALEKNPNNENYKDELNRYIKYKESIIEEENKKGQ